MASLSQTFRDAVIITRKMCVQYLWIDSLCIIQDSKADWESEAAKMGDYYRHSLFTISAAGAEDGSRGCFMQRDARIVRPCALSLKYADSEGHDEELLQVHLRPRDELGPWWRRAYSPLDRRGWVMQERILAPRTLLFESNQISWTCLEMQASERYPEGRKTEGVLRNLGRGDQVLRQAFMGAKLERGEWGSQARERLLELYDRWYDLVRQYSNLELKYESDIFPALSGIASLVQQAMGDEYVAGLWKSDLQRGLLWSAEELGERFEVWRAPSWSWGSVRGGVTFHDFEDPNEDRQWDLDCFSIQGVDVAVPGKNPLGQVGEGLLQVKGFLKVGLALKGEDVDEMLRKDEDDDDNILDTENGQLIGQLFPDAHDSVEGGIFCLPIIFEKGVFYTEDSAIPDEAWTATCLALAPSGDYDIYRRVGLARINDSRWFEDERVDLIIV